MRSLVVVGNCQAESLRLLLGAGDVTSTRLPAVHELTEADLGPLRELLATTDLLVTQPIADDYRGLPVGARQLADQLPSGATHVVVPTLRYAGLHPHHLLVHPPGLDDPDPPLAPYHDVRTTVSAAWLRAGRPEPEQPDLEPDLVRAVADASVGELRRREQRAGAVPASDLYDAPGLDHARTINHPGMAVLVPFAARVRAALGLPPADPGVTRPLLNAVHAPIEPAVVAAHGLPDPPRPHADAWLVDGTAVPVATVREAHLAWYADRPAMLDAALERSAELRRTLGLRTPEDVAC